MRLFVALLITLQSSAYAAEAAFSGMSYLDNGQIKIGVNLDIGGAITYLSKSGSDENIVNSHDWGRQIQMSFYSGPTPFEPKGKKPAEYWKFLGWNPIQSGDTYGNRSKVTDHKNDGKKITVECIPMHWPLDNQPAECQFRLELELLDNTVLASATILNHRSDKSEYSARGQEVPALYTNGTFYRLFTYDGDSPYTKGPLRQITKVWDSGKSPQEMDGGPWDNWTATEQWAALVNDEGFGLGIYSPVTTQFKGGFAGKPGAGGPKDAPTGYISPVKRVQLNHDTVYRYDYTLIVGYLDTIRATVYKLATR